MPRKSAADGEITRAALVDAAAHLFATQGISGVSIRSINSEAGLAPAAVHYHFGSKDALLDAVLERDGAQVRGEIARNADTLLLRRTKPSTRQLVETLATPYLDLIAREPVRGVQWLRIVAQVIAAGEAHLDSPENTVVSDKVTTVLRRRFPVAPEEQLTLIWRLAVTTLVQMLALIPADQFGASFGESAYTRTLTDFVAGGIDASMTQYRGTTAQEAG